MSAAVRIRPAEPADVELLHGLIVDLANYERAPERVVGTPELLRGALFGDRPAAEAVIAEVDGEPAGFAVFHSTFSTWECRPGIWLEDLYVAEARRRSGVGGALLGHLAAIAVARGCRRLEWSALTWNAPALAFYASLGADVLEEWRTHRLQGDALTQVAGTG